jgi:hypothetical protein
MQRDPVMQKIIKCPETERLEEIDFERTPCGIVIAGCSRFEPHCAVACTARCAAALDKLDRRDVEDRDPRVLVVYAGGSGRAKAIAEALSVHLSCDRLAVEVADADEAPPPPQDYDAIVIGTCVHRGRHSRSVLEYIARHGHVLAAMPAFFFSIGEDDIRRVWRATGRLPDACAVFAAADHSTLPGFLARFRPRLTSAADLLFAYSRPVHDFALKIADHIPSP